jgi:hypothetical protein
MKTLAAVVEENGTEFDTSRVAYPSAKIEASLGYRHRLGLAEALTAFVEARPR